MREMAIPLPGDVLFFESTSKTDTFGFAIAATQKGMGLEHYKYIHAALVVNSDLIVESLTDTGVHKVQLSSHKNPLEYFTATVLRKRSVASLFDRQDLEDIVKAAYYFYKEAYDWEGIFKRDVYSEGKSICSVFVKKALLQSKQATDEVFSGFPEQIYPAQLCGALIKAGYQPLEGGYDFEAWKKAYIPSPDIIKIMEDGRIELAELDELDALLTKFTAFAKTGLDQALFTDSPDLFKIVAVFESEETSVLEVLHKYFEDNLRYYESIESMIHQNPKTWRDKLQHAGAVMARIDLATPHVLSSSNFVAAFLNALPSKTLLGQLQGNTDPNLSDEERLTTILESIGRVIYTIFLVTRTTDLNDAESVLRESKVKLAGYRQAIAKLETLRKVAYPAFDDQYEAAILTVEKGYLNVVRQMEKSFGEQVISQLAAGAKNAVEQTWSSMRQWREKAGQLSA